MLKKRLPGTNAVPGKRFDEPVILMQLAQSLVVRHGNIVVGGPGGDNNRAENGLIA